MPNMKKFKSLADQYGTAEYGEILLALTQNAYCDTDFGMHDQPAVYFANAIDANGNDYRVKWQIVNPGAEDESEACNWENYEVYERK